MTTAHRPTWKAAVAQGSEGGWSAGGAVSHLRSALDAPAHTRLKVRRYTEEDNNNSSLHNVENDTFAAAADRRRRLVLESIAAIREAENNTSKKLIQERIGKRLHHMDPAMEERAKVKLLQNTAEIDVERIKAKYDDSDIEDNDDDIVNERDDESDLDDDDNELDDSDEDEEDDEAALQAELAKIRAEREASKRKAEAEANDEKEEAAAILGNPLLNIHQGVASGKLKRRWNDDVVFRNQAAGTATSSAAAKKRFINDTVRNDFHKRFLNKFIR
jgi:protein CWC15